MKYRFDPPMVSVGNEYVTVSCAFTIRLPESTTLERQECDVRLVHVGTPAADFQSRLTAASAAGLSIVEPGGDPLEFRSICSAVDACEALHRANPERRHYFIIFVHQQLAEDTQRLGQLIDGGERARTRYDVFGACGELDLRLLNQAGQLMGGEFVAPVNDQLDMPALRDRVQVLMDQRLQNITVSFQWMANVLPIHVFSFEERPHFLRDLGAESTPYTHRFFAGPMGSRKRSATFIFRALIRRKVAGDYKVGVISVTGRSNGEDWIRNIQMVQTATDDQTKIDQVDKNVGIALDRLRPSLWWEEICQAFTREDGNHIVRTFERLIAHEFEHQRLDSVVALRKMRMQFIRGGYFGLEALGRLWSLTHRSTSDLSSR
jgi:hypothetical protein